MKTQSFSTQISIVGLFVWLSLFFINSVVYAQDAREQNYLEQAEYQMAKSEGTISALNQFLQKYPYSRWREKAEYDRDRLAYMKAAQKGSSAAVQEFMRLYPNSAWLPNAQFMLNRLKKDEASRSGRKTSSEGKTPANEGITQTRTEKPSRYKKPEPRSGQDSVTRALAIYGDRRAEKQKLKEEELKVKQEQENHQRECNRMKDSIRRLGERVNWYDLDEKGERKFIPEDQVQQAKQRLIQRYNQKCG